MTNDRRLATRLNPYQEAIRLSALIELQRGIHSAYVGIKDTERSKAANHAATAYQDALAMLTHAKIPLSDTMVHNEITHLGQLLQQLEPQFNHAAA